MRKIILAITAFALTSVSYAASFSGVANGVYSTGVNSSSVVLSGGTIDPHFTLVKTPTGCSGTTCTDDANTPFGPDSYVILSGYPTTDGTWQPNDTTSKWIGPRSNQNTPLTPNNSVFASDTDFYVYRMVFNLTALNLNPATAAIQLRWWSDNSGAPSANQTLNSHIRLCGVSAATDPACGSGSLVAGSNHAGNGFSGSGTLVNIASGFTSNLMALDFVVYNSVVADNQFNPSGVRVQIVTATADVNSGIPEPGTFALFGSALVGLAMLRRRK